MENERLRRLKEVLGSKMSVLRVKMLLKTQNNRILWFRSFEEIRVSFDMPNVALR